MKIYVDRSLDKILNCSVDNFLSKTAFLCLLMVKASFLEKIHAISVDKPVDIVDRTGV